MSQLFKVKPEAKSLNKNWVYYKSIRPESFFLHNFWDQRLYWGLHYPFWPLANIQSVIKCYLLQSHISMHGTMLEQLQLIAKSFFSVVQVWKSEALRGPPLSVAELRLVLNSKHWQQIQPRCSSAILTHPCVCLSLESLHHISMYTRTISRLQSSALATRVKAQHPANVPRQAWGLADKKLKPQTPLVCGSPASRKSCCFNHAPKDI